MFRDINTTVKLTDLLYNRPLIIELALMLLFIFWSQNGTISINNLVFHGDIVLREATIEFLLV